MEEEDLISPSCQALWRVLLVLQPPHEGVHERNVRELVDLNACLAGRGLLCRLSVYFHLLGSWR